MLFVRCRTMTQWSFLIFVFLNVIRTVPAEKNYFPSDVKICSAKDPNLNNCFTDSANRMLKHLARGVRKLNAIPMDPLYIPFITLRKNNALLPTLAFNISDVRNDGWKNAVLLRSEINPEGREFKFVFRLPEYYLRGQYEIEGNIIDTPIEGSGNFNTTFTNISFDMLLRCSSKKIHGLEFLQIDDFRQTMHVEKMKVNFSNLFNDPAQSDATNNVINQNDRFFLDESNGFMNEITRKVHSALMQRIFDRVPYNAMFTNLDKSSADENLKK